MQFPGEEAATSIQLQTYSTCILLRAFFVLSANHIHEIFIRLSFSVSRDPAQFHAQTSSSVPHTRPETPRSVTHNHDEDYSDEDSDPGPNSYNNRNVGDDDDD